MSETFEFFHLVDGKQFLRPELFSKDAAEEARAIRRGNLKASQFRNYFQELRALEARFGQRREAAEAWHELRPQLELFKAKIAYGGRKEGPLVQERAFRDFMNKLVDAGSQSAEAFRAMMLFAEAVLAYYYAFESEPSPHSDDTRGRRYR